MERQPPQVAVLVVSHNTRDLTLRLLSSLERDGDRTRWEVVVLDNESSDGSADAIEQAHPWVRVIRNVPQRGFAAALNQGIGLTVAPTVVALNPDTVVPAGAIGRLVGALERDPRVAAVGPLIRRPDGRAQRQGQFAPRPYTALIVLLGLAHLPIFRREAARYYGTHTPGPPLPVELLPGTCLVIRRAAYEQIGPFDERFFVYCEDVDWCIRAGANGWTLLFVPEVAILHEKAASSRAAAARVIRLYYQSLRSFYEKHHAGNASPLARAAWRGGLALMERSALAANALRRRKGLRY